jgi:hypothetical protein
MSFLAPWALGLALLASLPVVLHLFRRDTRKRLAFPAVRYLRRARDQSARALKLRDRLLLFTRMGLIVAIAVAAAGPLLGRGDASDHAPTDLVLLLDNTGSMNRIVADTSLLDRQRSRALELLDAARLGDRFWVLPAVGSLLASGVGAEPAARAIGRVEETDAATNLGAAVREAVRLLPPGGTRHSEIVVLSDLQSTAVGGIPIGLPGELRLVVSRIGASPTNGAVADLQAQAPGSSSDGVVAVRLVSPAGGGDRDTIDVRLAIDGETVSIARAAVGGSAVLRLPNPGVGEYAVSVEIPPSGLRSDDRLHFILRTSEPPAIRHAGRPGSYVGQALATMDRAGRLRVVEATDAVAAWFVEGVPPTGISESTGPGWIFTPPADDDLLARFNSGIARLGLPWRVDAVDARGGFALAPSPDVPGLESIRTRGRRRLRKIGAAPDTVLLRTAEGSPWVVAGRTSGVGYLLISTPLDPEYTELPVDVAMLPFMEAVLFRWMGLGANLPAPVPAGVPRRLAADADSVALPDGKTVRVDGGSPYVPLRAGVHTVFHANGGESLLAVTVPASESDLTEATAARFVEALGSPEALVATSNEEWRAAMYGNRRGKRITPFLVVLALVLVLAEAALATPREPSPFRRPSAGRRT